MKSLFLTGTFFENWFATSKYIAFLVLVVNFHPAAAQTAAEDVETTLFDLYLGDKIRGRIAADYTSTFCRIRTVPDILDQLPELKDIAVWGPVFFKDEIPTGTSKESEGRSIRCFPETFRLVITVDESSIDANKQTVRLLPDPPEGMSLALGADGAASVSSVEEESFAFGQRFLFSQGKTRAIIDGTLVDSQRYAIDDASMRTYFKTFELGAGLLRTEGTTFFNSQQMLGVVFGNTHEVLTNQEGAYGSKIEIFVSTTSRVEFFKDDRLLSVQVLEFGLHRVDTSNFPQGSYPVEIVITSNDGSERRERRFFVKSPLLGLQDFPTFRLTAGALRQDTQLFEESVIGLSSSWPLTSWLQLGAQSMMRDTTTVFQSGPSFLYGETYGSFLYSQSNEGDRGITLRGQTGFYNARFDFDWSYALDGFSNHSDPNAIPPSDDGLRPGRRTDPLRLASSLQNTISSSCSYTLGAVDLRYQITKNDFDAQPRRYSRGPRIVWNLLREGEHRLTLSAATFQTERGRNDEVALEYAVPLDGLLGFVRPRAFRSSADDGYAGVVGISSTQRDSRGDGDTWSVRGEHYGSSSARDYGLLRAEGSHTDQQVSLAGFGQVSSQRSGGVTAAGANVRSALLRSPTNEFLLVRDIPREGTVLVTVGGKDSIETELLIDGQSKGTLVPGQRAAIRLSPFKTYTIAIRPSLKDRIVIYDSTPRILTLFPGTVAEVSFNANPAHIVLGRLVDEHGAPMLWARLKGLNDFTLTEDEGRFQAEMSGDEIVEVITEEGTCTPTLTFPATDDLVVDLGNVICRKN